MASNINRVMVTGNCTRDPEYRETAGGMGILTFGLAVNDRRRNSQTGDWEDYANFFDVTLFGNRASSLSGIIAKGMHLAIEGKLRWSQWQTNDGQNRSKVEIIADEVELPPRGQQNGAQAPTMQQGGGYPMQHGNGAYNAPQPSQMPPMQAQQYVNQQQAQMQAGVAQMQQANAVYGQMQQTGMYDEDIPF